MYFKAPASANIVQLPLFVIINILAALGTGIWISALTIRYRDFQHVVPFLVQVGLFATPIAYPATLVPEKYQVIYHLNPMAGVVEGFRWSLLGTAEISEYAWISFAVVIIIFISGLFYFRRIEGIMADII